MRKPCGTLTVLLVCVAVVVGCDSGSSTESVPFKATDTSQFKDMQDSMIKNIKKKPEERYKPEAAPKK